MPKCAGSSVHEALLRALSAGAIAPKRIEPSLFCAFDAFDALRPELRALVAVGEEEVEALRGYEVVSGHFSLPVLRRIAPPSAIATVIREPRARLLSLYAYWRGGDFTAWTPYRAHEQARRPLAEFLGAPAVAPAVDNVLCRMMLHDDSLLPADGHIASDSMRDVAVGTLEQVRQLGFVGVQEMSAYTWDGLSRFFGAPLGPRRVNVTPVPSSWDDDVRITPEVRELLEARTAAEQPVHRTILRNAGLGEREAVRLATSAFHDQCARLASQRG